MHKQSIPKSEIRSKESEVFDNAMNLIQSRYWKDARYNDFDVTTTVFSCSELPGPYDDYKQPHNVSMSPLRNLQQYTELLNELRFMFADIQKK